MIEATPLFLLGLVTLIAGAEALVRGASKLALSFGISPLVVGLTVVAMGTGAPELAVSVRAALEGQPDIAMGNVVGSNIANVLLVLGVSALVVPLVVAQQLIRQELPVMMAVGLLLYALGANGELGKIDGVLLLAVLVVYTVFLIWQSRSPTRQLAHEAEAELDHLSLGAWDRLWGVQLALVTVGLGLLVLGADWLVEAAVTYARWFGVSELVIGLTVVAVGTSLPEVATSVLAAARGQRDLAVGNVVGSNIFNILGVLGVGALAAPQGMPVASSILSFDLPVMLAVQFACLPIFFVGNRIERWEGALFVAFYVAYLIYLVLTAQQHTLRDDYVLVMTLFVLPLVALTLGVRAWREWRGARRPH